MDPKWTNEEKKKSAIEIVFKKSLWHHKMTWKNCAKSKPADMSKTKHNNADYHREKYTIFQPYHFKCKITQHTPVCVCMCWWSRMLWNVIHMQTLFFLFFDTYRSRKWFFISHKWILYVRKWFHYVLLLLSLIGVWGNINRCPNACRFVMYNRTKKKKNKIVRFIAGYMLIINLILNDAKIKSTSTHWKYVCLCVHIKEPHQIKCVKKFRFIFTFFSDEYICVRFLAGSTELERCEKAIFLLFCLVWWHTINISKQKWVRMRGVRRPWHVVAKCTQVDELLLLLFCFCFFFRLLHKNSTNKMWWRYLSIQLFRAFFFHSFLKTFYMSIALFV